MSKHWDRRWAEKAKLLEEYGGVPENFRSTSLVASIESRGPKIREMSARLDALAVSDEMRRDTLVGKPSHYEVIRGVPMTMMSLRHAYFAHTLSGYFSDNVPMHVMEIGAGYGGLAATLSRALDIRRYVFVDHRSCLKMQEFFARRALGDMLYLSFVDIESSAVVHDGSSMDLIINTHSFAEMNASEVQRHFDVIQSENGLAYGGALYSVNLREWKVTSFCDLPFDQYWRHELVRFSRYDSRYVESLSYRDSSANSPHPVKMLELTG